MLYLSNQEIASVLTMKGCIEALEEGLREYYRGDATCRPRIDVWAPCHVPEAYFQWAVWRERASAGGFSLCE